MSENPGDVMVWVIIAAIVLFIVAAGASDVLDGWRRFVSTRQRKRKERSYSPPLSDSPDREGPGNERR